MSLFSVWEMWLGLCYVIHWLGEQQWTSLCCQSGCSGWIFLSIAASSTGAAAEGHHIPQYLVTRSKSCSFISYYKPLKYRVFVIQRTTPKFSFLNFSRV